MTEPKTPSKSKLQAFDPRLGDIWKKGALARVQYSFPSTRLAVRFLFRLNLYRRAAEHDKHPDSVIYRRAKGSRQGNVVTLQPADFEFEVLFSHIKAEEQKLPGQYSPTSETETTVPSETPVSIDDLLSDIKKD